MSRFVLKNTCCVRWLDVDVFIDMLYYIEIWIARICFAIFMFGLLALVLVNIFLHRFGFVMLRGGLYLFQDGTSLHCLLVFGFVFVFAFRGWLVGNHSASPSGGNQVDGSPPA